MMHLSVSDGEDLLTDRLIMPRKILCTFAV